MTLGGHPNPAIDGHLKTAQRRSDRFVNVSNVLSDEMQKQVIAPGHSAGACAGLRRKEAFAERLPRGT